MNIRRFTTDRSEVRPRRPQIQWTAGLEIRSYFSNRLLSWICHLEGHCRYLWDFSYILAEYLKGKYSATTCYSCGGTKWAIKQCNKEWRSHELSMVKVTLKILCEYENADVFLETYSLLFLKRIITAPVHPSWYWILKAWFRKVRSLKSLVWSSTILQLLYDCPRVGGFRAG